MPVLQQILRPREPSEAPEQMRLRFHGRPEQKAAIPKHLQAAVGGRAIPKTNRRGRRDTERPRCGHDQAHGRQQQAQRVMEDAVGNIQGSHQSRPEREQNGGWHDRRQSVMPVLRQEIQGRGSSKAHTALPEEIRQMIINHSKFFLTKLMYYRLILI